MTPQYLLAELVRTVARIFAIAKVMNVGFPFLPNAVEDLLAFLGTHIVHWVAKPELLPDGGAPTGS